MRKRKKQAFFYQKITKTKHKIPLCFTKSFLYFDSVVDIKRRVRLEEVIVQIKDAGKGAQRVRERVVMVFLRIKVKLEKTILRNYKKLSPAFCR